MQEKTINLIIKVVELAVGIAIAIKDHLKNGGNKHDDSGASETK